MNTILKKQPFNNLTMMVLSILLFTIHSCKSTDDTPSSGDAVLNVILAGDEFAQDDDVIFGDQKSASTGRSGHQALAGLQTVQDTTIMLSPGFSVDMTLVDQTYASAGAVNKLASTNGALAASKTVRTPLAEGVKYKLVVYNADGSYKTQKDYVYGPAKTTDTIAGLDAGKPYIFVAYSINSKTELPSIGTGNLSSAKLTNVTGDLMTFKKTVTLNYGPNDLSVVLKHRFSQVTTTLQMDSKMTGYINKLTGIKFGTTNSSADLSFADDQISYNGTADPAISFPSLGTGLRTVTSTNPTLLINAAATNKNLNFGEIVIDGESRTNKSLPGIKITPGHKYDLILTFKQCTQEVAGGTTISWSYERCGTGGAEALPDGGCKYKAGDIITSEFTAQGADYGFVFDITEMDNSFNMKVGDKTLANNEIQFQKNQTPNIEFADGSQYAGINVEGGTINEVYNLHGTAAAPILRIVISRTGDVTMFGSKTSGGPLYPLRFKNNSQTHFNTPFQWFPTGTNTVYVTQKVDGLTIMKGHGSGVKRIICPPEK